MGTSDGAGRFRIERAGFTAPADCTVAVNDGSATAATATLAGCTVSAPPPPTTPSLAALTLGQTTVVGGTPVTATVSLTSSAPARGRGGLAVKQQPHGGDGAAERHGPGGVDGGHLHGDHQPGGQLTIGNHHRHRGRSDQVHHPDRDHRVPGHQREVSRWPEGGPGADGSPPSRQGSTVSSPPPRRPAPAATSSSRPAPRSGWRPVLPRTRASWARSSRPPVGTLPRSRWPLASPTSAARYSG
jgi:hypothetical protein